MAFSSYDSIIAALASGNGEDSPFSKATLAATTAGRFYSLWKAAGYPAAGATPTTGAGAVPTEATQGALKFTDPSGSNTKHLLRFGAGGATACGNIRLIDRLCHTSGLDGTNTGAQTVNSTALTRKTSGVGVLVALEVYTALGATPRTATISYTNQDGTAGRSGTISVPASAEAGSFLCDFALQGTDTGVRSVQTVTLSGSTGTAGDFGVTLYFPITEISFLANEYRERDLVLQFSQLPEIVANSCLSLVVLATTTTTGQIVGECGFAQG